MHMPWVLYQPSDKRWLPCGGSKLQRVGHAQHHQRSLIYWMCLNQEWASSWLG